MGARALDSDLCTFQVGSLYFVLYLLQGFMPDINQPCGKYGKTSQKPPTTGETHVCNRL